MLYLLDANVLIDANRDYYPLARVPEFWEWLVDKGSAGHVKIQIEIYEEIKAGTDALAVWAKDHDTSEALLFDQEVDVGLVSTSVSKGYAPDLTDDEVEKLGRDPFLIAHALADLGNRCVVTTEVSKPSKQRANRHIPDVCNHFDIPVCNTFELLDALNFSTSWNE